MAKSLKAAFAELNKQAWGQTVAKGGFEVGERVIAYVGFYTLNAEGRIDENSHAMIMRHDNGRNDLKEYKYCEIIDERNAWGDCPNDMQTRIMEEMQWAWKNIIDHGNAYQKGTR